MKKLKSQIIFEFFMCDDTVSFKKIDYICINKYNGFFPKRLCDVELEYFAIGEYKNRRYDF